MQNYIYRLELPTQIPLLSIDVALGLLQCAIRPKPRCVESILERGKLEPCQFENMSEDEELQAMQDDDDDNTNRKEMTIGQYAEKFPENETRRRLEEVLFRLFNEGSIQLIDHCGILPSETVVHAYDIDICAVKLSFLDFVKYANAVKVGVSCDQVLILPTKDHDPVRESEHVALQMSGAALECNQVVTETPESPTPLPAGASDGVELAKAGPVEDGLSTKEISDTFGDVNGWDASRWIKNLSSSKWLHPARIALGDAGGASSVWNPLTLAQLMHSKKKGDKAKEKIMQALNSRFARNPILEPWRDAFNEYLATHCTTD